MNKLQDLKKQLIKVTVICVIIIAVFGGLAFFSLSYDEQLSDELNKVNSEVKKIASDESTAKRDFKGLTEASDVYNNIPEKRRPTPQGFSTPQERIRAIVPIINDIKEKYRLPLLEYSFNGRPRSDESIPLRYAEGYTNDLSFTFSALTDELALAAIKTLIDEMPGYMVLNSLSIDASTDYSKELVNQLSAGNLDVEVVKGTATFAWKTLKSLEKPREIKKSKKRRR